MDADEALKHAAENNRRSWARDVDALNALAAEVHRLRMAGCTPEQFAAIRESEREHRENACRYMLDKMGIDAREKMGVELVHLRAAFRDAASSLRNMTDAVMVNEDRLSILEQHNRETSAELTELQRRIEMIRTAVSQYLAGKVAYVDVDACWREVDRLLTVDMPTAEQ